MDRIMSGFILPFSLCFCCLGYIISHVTLCYKEKTEERQRRRTDWGGGKRKHTQEVNCNSARRNTIGMNKALRSRSVFFCFFIFFSVCITSYMLKRGSWQNDLYVRVSFPIFTLGEQIRVGKLPNSCSCFFTKTLLYVQPCKLQPPQ